MASLTTCIAKAGDLMTPEQKQALIDRAAELRARGMKSAEADRQAVRDLAADADGRLSEVETAITEGRTLYSPAEPRQTTQANGEPMSAVQQLAADRPDLEVRLPGDENTMRLDDAIKRIEAEKLADTQFAELVRVAAACALTAPAAI